MKKHYECPTVEAVAIENEAGFAFSTGALEDPETDPVVPWQTIEWNWE